MASVPCVTYQSSPGHFVTEPVSSVPFTGGLTTPLQASVANPAVGNATIFVNSAGDLALNSALGNVFVYTPNPADQNQNMNGFGLTNVLKVSTFNSDVIYGLGASSDLANQGNVIMGNFATAVGGCAGIVLIGPNASATSGVTNAIGIGNSCVLSGDQAMVLGDFATASGPSAIALGRQAFASGGLSLAFGPGATASGAFAIAVGRASQATDTGAIAIGSQAANTIAHSCLIGDTSIAHIRSNNASLACDLGTSAAPFKSCWLKNAGLATSGLFSQYTDVTLTNSAVETSLLTGSQVGALVLAASQQVGSILRFRLVFSLTVAVADTITLRFYANGVLMATSGAIGGGVFAAVPGMAIAEFTVRAANLAAVLNASVNGGTSPLFTYGAPAYNPAVANTFTLTGQWSAAAVGDSFVVHNIYAENVYST